MLAVAVSLPVVGIAAVVGLLVAALQAVTQLQDSTNFAPAEISRCRVGPRAGRALDGRAIATFAEQAFRGG